MPPPITMPTTEARPRRRSTTVRCADCGRTEHRDPDGTMPGWFWLTRDGSHVCPSCLLPDLGPAREDTWTAA